MTHEWVEKILKEAVNRRTDEKEEGRTEDETDRAMNMEEELSRSFYCFFSNIGDIFHSYEVFILIQIYWHT